MNQGHSKTFLFAGGGTGGHVSPGLALGEELRGQCDRCRLVWVGNPDKIESRVTPSAGFEFVPYRSRGIIRGRRPKQLLANLGTLLALISAVPLMRAIRILDREKPSAVIGTGGYVSLMPGIAAWIRRIPLFLLEQNARPGLATRILSRFARAVFTTAEESKRCFSQSAAQKIECLGNPVRKDFVKGVQGTQRTNERTVFVLGGSQGARSLNEAIWEWVETGLPAGVAVLHQTGEQGIGRSRELATINPAYRCFAYDPDIAAMMAGADLVVSRAGANALVEILCLKKPSILIPYPWAADNHQEANARWAEQNGAARLLLDKELMGGTLAGMIESLFQDSENLEKMSTAAGSLARPDAGKAIAKRILAEIG